MTSTLLPPEVPTSRYVLLPLAAVATTLLAWASAFVVIRSTGEAFSAGALALGRLLVGSIALGVVLLSRHRWVRPSRREWLLVIGCGLAWFAAYNVALNAAEQRIDAGTTAMLVNIGPLLIAVFAGLWMGEGFPRWLVVGMVVAFVGVTLIGVSTANTAEADVAGVVLSVVAAVTYAVGRTPAEADPPPAPGHPGHLARLHCRDGRLSARRRDPCRRAPRRVRRKGRRPALPGARTDRAGVQRVGVCVGPDERRQAQRHHLSRAAADGAAGLAAAR